MALTLTFNTSTSNTRHLFSRINYVWRSVLMFEYDGNVFGMTGIKLKLTAGGFSRFLRSQSNPGLTIWMTQSCWTCCLSLRDSAKKKRFTESCRIWEAGSRTHHRAACALHPLPLSTATSLRLRQILPHTPLLSLPQGEALESHCGNLHVSPSLLSSPGDWLPSECHQKRKKNNTKYPRSTVFDKNHTRKCTEHPKLIILGTKC